jgi:hypothetical protein
VTGPSDTKKAALRERIRLHSFTRRARNLGGGSAVDNSAREIYEKLRPIDLERIPVVFVNKRSQRGSENSCILRD